ncbi:plasmid replication protein RepC [Labrys sp. KB_33_2]|uniref:plasmid replication protein RepC n=1 Tax=Labrys sp. KB_33_2 TaxID=3237479 RepID=UPI003F8E79D1
MPQATQIASFRRITPAILASARLAMANDVPEVSKAEVAVILKKAAPVLGIDGSTYHIMDILIGLSRADDWKGANRPIVAISNAKLAQYTARSQRQVTRCIRRLVEAGIVAYRDSPTGRRFIYRDKDGEIDKGYGLDFTPARVRIEELKALAGAFQLRLSNEQAARRTKMRLSRAVVDACEAYPDFAGPWREELDAIVTQGLPVEVEAQAFEDLHLKIVNQATHLEAVSDLSAEGDTSDSPNINTTPPDSIESNSNWPRSTEREHHPEDHGRHAAAFPTEKKSARALPTPPRQNAAIATRSADEIQSLVLSSISVGLLRSACPQACEIAGRPLKSWPDLAGCTEIMRRLIGLSEVAWREGISRVGRYGAAAILITVLEKSVRNPDQISSPGGYFRAMIDRAMDGRLHLEKTLFGLADSALKREQEQGG